MRVTSAEIAGTRPKQLNDSEVLAHRRATSSRTKRPDDIFLLDGSFLILSALHQNQKFGGSSANATVKMPPKYVREVQVSGLRPGSRPE